MSQPLNQPVIILTESPIQQRQHSKMITQNLKVKTQNQVRIDKKSFFNLISFCFFTLFTKLGGLALIFYFLISNVFPVSAQNNNLPLVVYPARQSLEVEPGEKTSVVVNFVNQAKEPVSGFIRIVDFIVRDNQGTPELIENTFDAPEKYAASSWFKTEFDKITLPANNETVTIQARISVPKNANPGGKYVAIYFQAQPFEFATSNSSQHEVGTTISPRLASLIYLKVKGPIKESAFVAKFQPKQSFFEYGPVEIITEILNRGDYHISPRGEIILTDVFGRVVDKSLLKKEVNIFPDTTRTFSNTLGKKWMIGKYRASLTATYGEKNTVLTAFSEFWVFPWKVVMIIVLTLIIIILLVRHFYISTLLKEKLLEKQLEQERREIEELKKELKKRDQ